MQLLFKNKLNSVFAVATAVLGLLSTPLVQAESCGNPTCFTCQTASSDDYLRLFPWLGLAMDEVTYGPITVSDVHINQGSKIAFAKPGEVLYGSLRYRVDSTNQHMFHRYHLVVGLKGIGAQDCVTHTYGIWDSSGKGKFTLKAPLEPGVYEVRFFYQEAHTCEEARSVWNDEMGEPSGFATVGAIIVE